MATRREAITGGARAPSAGGINTKVGDGAGAPEAGKKSKEKVREDRKRKTL